MDLSGLKAVGSEVQCLGTYSEALADGDAWQIEKVYVGTVS